MQISFKLKIFKCNKVELHFLKLVSRYVLFQELKVKVTVLRECEFYKYLDNKVELNFLKLVSKYVLLQELKVKVTVLRECEFYKYLELWNMHEKLGRRARDEQKEAF